jgi:hypothetical protein
MLVCKILEGLIRLFGKIRFDESTHPLDGGLFAAFGGLSDKLKRRRKGSRPHLDHRNSSNVGSINTQMMLNRHSTNQTAIPFSGRTSHESYLSGRPSMGQWGENNVGYASVPGVDNPQEILMDSAPTRGFSVVRGGRAVYQDPYAVLPGANGPMPDRVSYPPNSRSLTSPDRRTTFAPLPSVAENGSQTGFASAQSRPVRHTRTRSQTAIVESFNPGPEGHMPGALGPPAQTGRSTNSFTVNRGAPPPIPLILQNTQPEYRPVVGTVTPLGDDDDDSLPKKSSKPSSWFGRSKTNVNLEDSDSEEDLSHKASSRKTDGKEHGGGGSSGGWLSALLPGSSSKRNSAELVQDTSSYERSPRQDAEILLDADNGSKPSLSEAPMRSFRVNRQPQPLDLSGQRRSPHSSNPTSPRAFGNVDLPGSGSERPQQESQRSFVVSRANRSAGGSASSSRVTTPGNEPSAPFATLTPFNNETRSSETGLQVPGRSFVVNRANKSNTNVAQPGA